MMDDVKLYIVSTPIGNYADMTIRALKTLEKVDCIICEEYKEVTRLMRFFKIDKELIQLNEHNEKKETEEIVTDILEGKSFALVSDCGTPAFEDPGNLLIQRCIEFGIPFEFIPGANSLLTAIVLSGFDISRFYYIGFLSPKSDERKRQLFGMQKLDRVFVILDAPYRLATLLKDLELYFPERNIFIGFDLTIDTESKKEVHFRGTAREILTEIGEEKIKGEFVVIVDKNHK
jgi:16S rRNA (cytidine1402-2'-O)-methyltransferase